jgi:hypothetical protein
MPNQCGFKPLGECRAGWTAASSTVESLAKREQIPQALKRDTF